MSRISQRILVKIIHDGAVPLTMKHPVRPPAGSMSFGRQKKHQSSVGLTGCLGFFGIITLTIHGTGIFI